MKTLYRRGFTLKPTERAHVPLKQHQEFLKNPPFERLVRSYVTITRDFELFQNFICEIHFLKKENTF